MSQKKPRDLLSLAQEYLQSNPNTHLTLEILSENPSLPPSVFNELSRSLQPGYSLPQKTRSRRSTREIMLDIRHFNKKSN